MTGNDAVVQRVLEIIDDEVRPYIEMDGGRIDFMRLEDGVVYVRLSGACHTCPSSTLTLKGGVERTIRKHLPEITSVELEGVAPLPKIGAGIPTTCITSG